MKYLGMPWGMWAVFSKSFQTQLMEVFGYDANTAASITRDAKPRYRNSLPGCQNLKRLTVSK